MGRPPSIIITPGQQFGRLTVLGAVGRAKSGHKIWRCQCICGAITDVLASNLRRKNTQSCGCLKRDLAPAYATKYRGASSRQHPKEYSTWLNMKHRVGLPSHGSFPDYGGRGITMCERWSRWFPAFLEDKGPRPSPAHSIERRDVNGHYSCGRCVECKKNGWPDNCYWATWDIQANNKRTSHFLTYRGQTLTLTQWAKTLGVPPNTVRNRCHRHPDWPPERILSVTSLNKDRRYVAR